MAFAAGKRQSCQGKEESWLSGYCAPLSAERWGGLSGASTAALRRSKPWGILRWKKCLLEQYSARGKKMIPFPPPDYYSYIFSQQCWGVKQQHVVRVTVTKCSESGRAGSPGNRQLGNCLVPASPWNVLPLFQGWAATSVQQSLHSQLKVLLLRGNQVRLEFQRRHHIIITTYP